MAGHAVCECKRPHVSVFLCPARNVIVVKAGFFAIPSVTRDVHSPHSISVSRPPLSPPPSIGSNQSPPCIQGLSAGGRRQQRWSDREREIYYWWCLPITVESCSGLHERALLDNVCSCNLLRRVGWGGYCILTVVDCMVCIDYIICIILHGFSVCLHLNSQQPLSVQLRFINGNV